MTADVVKKGRGGYRPGAGRKTKDGIKGVGTITLTMDAETEQIAYELGDGDYGVGVRRAIKELIRLRKAAKGIYVAPPAQEAPQPRKSILRTPTKVKEEPPAPKWRTGIPVSNDWEVED